jgi:hypothetical protein
MQVSTKRGGYARRYENLGPAPGFTGPVFPFEEKALAMVLSDGFLKSDYIHPNVTGYH